MCAMCMGCPSKIEKGVEPLREGVTDSCESPDVGARNGTKNFLEE